MNDFLQALVNPQVPFIRYALIAGVISSIPFGCIGSFVVVKRMSYIAGAISHAVLGGIGMALFFQSVFGVKWLSPLVGAFIFAVLAAFILSFIVIYSKERVDSVIGTIWALGMSIGLLFMARTPEYVDPMSYLYGNILLVGKNELFLITILNIFIMVFCLIFYQQLLAVAFDQEYAEIKGLNTAFYQILLIVLIAVTVVLMITIIGIIMVIALLTIPAAISSLFAKKLWHMILTSVFLCIVFTVFGLATSYMVKLPTSSVTIIIIGIFYFFILILNSFFSAYGKKLTKIKFFFINM